MHSMSAALALIEPDLSSPLAAVDMGSNSFRLEIARLEGGRYEPIVSLKETVRLGAGLDAQGRLDEAAAQRGLACLARFAPHLRSHGVRHVHAVGTQTLREAGNRKAFLARAQVLLGCPVTVLSGDDEARMAYAGVMQMQSGGASCLVIDIGGRSTELAQGHGGSIHAARTASCPVGSIGLSMRCFPDGHLDAAGLRLARQLAGEVFAAARPTFVGTPWQHALGSSGTVQAVSSVLAAHAVTDGTITPAGLHWLLRQCLRAGHVDRLALHGLQDSRRALIGGALAILSTLLADFGIQRLHPVRGALRHGLILDLDRRLRASRLQPDKSGPMRSA